ncbi:MAG: cobalamin biosynthesis protein [Rickettsiales bacterium]|nr:cobalamin biosynthesis protein [Rickettsiales bacterium]
MEHAILALCAILLNAVLVGPRRFYTNLPLFLITRQPAQWIRHLERKLNRDQRSAKERQVRGIILLGGAVAISIFLGWFMGLLPEFFELAALVLLLPIRPSFDTAIDIRKYVQAGEMVDARNVLSGTVWRHHALLDEPGVLRAAMELLVMQFAEKILCPVFWYVIFGLPGLLAARLITLMHETISPGASEQFGLATRVAYIALHYVPAYITAFFCVMAAFFLGHGKAVAKHIWESIQLSLPLMILSTAASALQVSLGGPSSPYTQGVWVGSGTPKPTTLDIRRGLYLFGLLNMFLFVLLGLFV